MFLKQAQRFERSCNEVCSGKKKSPAMWDYIMTTSESKEIPVDLMHEMKAEEEKSSSSLAAEMTPEQREMGREVAQNTPKRPSSVKCPKCGKDESHLKRHMARRHGWSAKHYNKWVRQVRMQANKDKRRVVKCPVKACNWARAAP
ncbi:uncharacterized protein LOC5507938 isoform X1 [Nematostella vectensis]|uniref:uncharacterized protein LOC5507938 isoform X1 n=1 Tax=Nematostella vectensis TaxID=45351 RepID=UPI002076F599|nr:uncharacterized protein LOC5507938 isoform X1 [Nematostella vectensis]